MSFAFPDQTRYRYRLDGYDEVWVEGITYGAASYTNLAPGDYTFRVHAYRQGESRPGAEARLAVTIPPAVSQTAWFRALALTALVGLLTGVHRARVARVLALERLRQRIAADLHDDVGSRLSVIALLSRIEHDFAVEAELPVRTLSLEFRRNVYLMYKEALQNVIKHSGAAYVKTEISAVNGVLRVSVLDDGRGFDPAEVNGGYGLANMRRRGEAAGGTTVIRRRPEGGTEVSFVGRMS